MNATERSVLDAARSLVAALDAPGHCGRERAVAEERLRARLRELDAPRPDAARTELQAILRVLYSDAGLELSVVGLGQAVVEPSNRARSQGVYPSLERLARETDTALKCHMFALSPQTRAQLLVRVAAWLERWG